MIAAAEGGLSHSKSALAQAAGVLAIETLGLRMERHVRNAVEVASWLAAAPRGGAVSCAGLPSSPYHDRVQRLYPKGAGALFTIRDWWWVYVLGIWIYMALVPAVEAAEQTVIQRVVPFRQQGCVFGFAMTFEAASAPITASR